MKALVWDVETTDMELAIRTYQLKNNIRYFPTDSITRDWTMLGAAWMWLDSEHASAVSVSPQKPLDDRQVVEALHNILSQAEVLIGHNADGFDYKKFNARAIYYDLPPLQPKQSIDTLKIARKYFKFTSNKLSYICQYLGLQEKELAPDWKKVIEGCPDELRNMRDYNKQDVIATRDLYFKLRSYHHTHPAIVDKAKDVQGNLVDTCQKCGSPDTVRDGFRRLASGRKRQVYKCKSCFSYTSGELI